MVVSAQVAAIAEREGAPVIYFIHDVTGASGAYCREFTDTLSSKYSLFTVCQSTPFVEMGKPAETLIERSLSYAKAIIAQQPSGPYYLLGYSLGGMLAAEIACRLNEMKKNVGMVVVIDTPPVNRLPKLENKRFIQILTQLEKIMFREFTTFAKVAKMDKSKQDLIKSFFEHCKQRIKNTSDEKQKKMQTYLLKNIVTNLRMELASSQSNLENFSFLKNMLILSTSSTQAQYKLGNDLGWRELMPENNGSLSITSFGQDVDHFNIFRNESSVKTISDMVDKQIKRHRFTDCKTELLSMWGEIDDDEIHEFMRELFASRSSNKEKQKRKTCGRWSGGESSSSSSSDSDLPVNTEKSLFSLRSTVSSGPIPVPPKKDPSAGASCTRSI